MGSFHSEDIEALIRIPEASYSPPELPFYPITMADTHFSARQAQLLADAASTSFGHEMRERHFLLDPSWTFVNHGAFGGVVRSAFEEAEQWRRYCESQPLRFFDRDLLPHLAHSVRSLAQFIGAPATDMVLLPNATAGLNVAINGVVGRPRKTGDRAQRRVFLFDSAYGSVKTMAAEACKSAGAALDIVPLPVPLPADPLSAREAIVQAARNAIQPGTALAIFDHTASNLAINFPIDELVAVARNVGAITLIDGAHGLLARPLALGGALGADEAASGAVVKGEGSGADLYVSNCHKWLASPKSCGFLFARPEYQALCEPLAVSHGHGRGFLSSHVWDGCRDYAAALTLPRLLQFWGAVGAEASRGYSEALVHDAAIHLGQAWGTLDEVNRWAGPAPLALHGSMALIPLPQSVPGRSSGATSADAKMVQDALHTDHRVECPIKCVGGRLYARISAQIYNQLEDYERLGDAVLAYAHAC
jgi:selenocysteine lyase/cysteine desulfurase